MKDIEVKIIRVALHGEVFADTVKAEIIEIEGRTCFQYYEDDYYQINDFETGCRIAISSFSYWQAFKESRSLLSDRLTTEHRINMTKKTLEENGIAFPVNSYDLIPNS